MIIIDKRAAGPDLGCCCSTIAPAARSQPASAARVPPAKMNATGDEKTNPSWDEADSAVAIVGEAKRTHLQEWKTNPNRPDRSTRLGKTNPMRQSGI